MEVDEFELYDLRVEVVVSDDRKIQCNAKPGDWFEVRGEMLHFPPGQGFRCTRWRPCCRCCRPSNA